VHGDALQRAFRQRARRPAFDKAIIAAGSQTMKLSFMPEGERVVGSTGALQ
jgi:hypothetical protein